MDGDHKENKKTLAEREKEILAFWEREQIFKKSLDKKAPKGEFVFYDGPPFATGLPHYGHILAGTIKDVIPRYKTMRGFTVRRRWGWDCHGLPVENIVEKELGLKAKKDIETFGIAKFNEVARKEVLRFSDDWRKIVPRLGRFVDMENDYKTMDTSYTESVWWAFKTLSDKNLVYQGFKSMQICPRCETTLSNFEVGQGYKDITDISVYAKFKILDSKFRDSYLVAWTTTPWTLPGNAALAINPKVQYSKVEKLKLRSKGDDLIPGTYIFAKERVATVLKDYEYKIVEEFSGSELVGLSYEPVFKYYSNDAKLKNKENGWKVYGADFVTTVDGTGIVHIAPAFGEDDMELGKKHNLPFIQHVGMDGRFKPEVTDFAGLFVKPKDDSIVGLEHQQTDIEILKYLAKNSLLFAKERITHSYPHCWRCETPLLNYAASSWFVKVTTLKDKLIRENKKIRWIPEEVGEGRFGNWLQGARDWAISRSRFWGAPIPVWKCEKCEALKTIGSLADIKEAQPPRNRYFVMRHGETTNNVQGIMSSRPLEPHHLTERGRDEVRATAELLKKEKIDLIFVSPFIRTLETSDIVKAALEIPDEKVFEDKRLEEIKVGIFDGKSVSEYHASFTTEEERFAKAPLGGEDFNATKRRMGEFLYDVDKRLEGKNILVITHESPAWLLFSAAKALRPDEAINLWGESRLFLENAEVKKLSFVPLPHNENYELDVHRPFIDAVEFNCGACGSVMRRVPEVFDCWFESGSMPFAEAHYPFENLKTFNPKSGILTRSIGYPADFIAEGIDQTRGWFYSMLVISVALFGKSAYKSVIVNGTILNEKGEKMSKSKRNYPDPVEVLEKYSADALRWYLLSSPAVRGQDVLFSERGVDEVMKKVLQRLDNVLSFYLLYASDLNATRSTLNASPHILDQWILALLQELTRDVTASLESYELDYSTRAIADFIEDLSVWYLRRSRDRFKGDDEKDKQSALSTLRYILLEVSKLMAPFTPFFAESVYRQVNQSAKIKVQNDNAKLKILESVHLEEWSKVESRIKNQESGIIKEMREVRKIVSLALEARSKAGIKVRQPLATLRIKNHDSRFMNHESLLGLIKDEVNVKEVSFDSTIKDEVELDTTITKELKEEGTLRDFIRAVQELRKKKGLSPNDLATLHVSGAKEFVEKNSAEIKRAVRLQEIFQEQNALSESIVLDDVQISIDISMK